MEKDTTTLLKNIHESKIGEAQPLYIRTAVFSKREIGQSQPYPCSQNTICVTLQASVPLTLQKKSYFILQSFVGAIAPAGEIKLFDSTGSGDVSTLQSAFENGNKSKGLWTVTECSDPGMAPGQVCPSLKISVSCRIEAGTQISFCFNVTNPATPQDSPQTMTVLNSDSMSYQDLDYGRSLLALPYASVRDREPMYIRTPAFTLLQIEQSSPFPSDQNTILISLKTNVSPSFYFCNYANFSVFAVKYPICVLTCWLGALGAVAFQVRCKIVRKRALRVFQPFSI
jgi:hypothetical protein